ncbi:hypothetical protein [Nostoc sp.]|uniref:hypothetical protein n=1 Tax=Nostoc sp. TaxID=1180 RepID=UPI002FFBFF4F
MTESKVSIVTCNVKTIAFNDYSTRILNRLYCQAIKNQAYKNLQLANNISLSPFAGSFLKPIANRCNV